MTAGSRPRARSMCATRWPCSPASGLREAGRPAWTGTTTTARSPTSASSSTAARCRQSLMAGQGPGLPIIHVRQRPRRRLRLGPNVGRIAAPPMTFASLPDRGRPGLDLLPGGGRARRTNRFPGEFFGCDGVAQIDGSRIGPPDHRLQGGYRPHHVSVTPGHVGARCARLSRATSGYDRSPWYESPELHRRRYRHRRACKAVVLIRIAAVRPLRQRAIANATSFPRERLGPSWIPTEVLASVWRSIARRPANPTGLGPCGLSPFPARVRPLLRWTAGAGPGLTPWSPPMFAPPICGQWPKQFGADRLYQITGHTAHPLFTLFKLLWLNDTVGRQWHVAGQVPLLEDLLHFRLGLDPAMGWPLAGRTMLFDVRRHMWSEGMTSSESAWHRKNWLVPSPPARSSTR